MRAFKSLSIWRTNAFLILSLTLVVWTSSHATATSADAAKADDPIELVAPLDNGGPSGFRFSTLSKRQINALRRTVTLPLDAIITAGLKEELLSEAKVQPLPDHSAPFLPLSNSVSNDSSIDPFISRAGALVRDPLAELFAAESGIEPPAPGQEDGDTSEDPFVGDSFEADPFEAEETTTVAPPPADEEQEDADLEDDPFADF